jgi:hypothetical protein
MRRVQAAIAFLIWVFTAMMGLAAEPSPGKYKFFVARGVDTDLAVCILTLDQKDGAWTATMVGRNTALGKVTVGTVKMADGFLRIDMNISDEDVIFEGAAGKTIIGSCGADRRLNVATLIATDEDVVVRERMTTPRDLPPPMKDFAKLEAERTELQKLVNRSATVGDTERLTNDLERVQKRIEEERSKLMAKVLTEHADHPLAAEAGVNLLFHCYHDESSPDQLRSWLEAMLKSAARLGPRYRRDVLLLAVDYLGRNPKAQSLAAELAERADWELGANESMTVQTRILATLATALKNSGQTDRAAEVEERLVKLDAKLDEEYRARLPKIAVKPFGKRKDKANCVAFFELFIGAEGQSGAAAGAAFDKLMEAYKPNEAVALQYHLHVPAPDALANTDGDARFDYYAKKYPNNTDVIPASFVNGRPRACGGGTLPQSRTKIVEYCEGINPLVNEITPVKLTAKAKCVEDRIEIEVKAEDIPADSKERRMRLRLALVEDSIRYPGGNGLRFYRHVVRAMPGGSNGAALNKDIETRKETVVISELRARLSKELDKLGANGTPLPTPYRPLELKNLKVIAWVQSDGDRAVWQAVQTDVTE